MPLTCAVGNVLDECPHGAFGKLRGFCDGVLPFASPIAASLFDQADPNQRVCGRDELRSYPPIRRSRIGQPAVAAQSRSAGRYRLPAGGPLELSILMRR